MYRKIRADDSLFLHIGKNCNLINVFKNGIMISMDKMKVKSARPKNGRRLNRNKIRFLLIMTLSTVVAAAVIFVSVVAIVNFISDRSSALREPTQVVSSIENNQEITLTLAEGDVCKLALPESVDLSQVEFVSSDEKVVRVDSSGRADALSEGEASVTASSNGFSAVCDFKVEGKAEITRPDEITTAITANEDVLTENQKSSKSGLYSITVNRRTNTVTVYTYDKNKKYTVPVRAMVASCGTKGDDITPTGDYHIYFKENWHGLYGNVYGMYVSGFQGPYLFHSIPYAKSGHHDTLKVDEFNKLGENASQGCVRMMVSDVNWIFKNCPMNTPVKVIDDSEKADPLGTPATVKISGTVKWDPTDPDKRNPYLDKMPEILGAKDRTMKKGEEFKAFDGITAKDICGNDITIKLEMMGSVLTDKPGEYYVTYSVTDDFSLKTSVTVCVIVE